MIGGKESGRVAKPDTRHCRLAPASAADDGSVDENDLEHRVDFCSPGDDGSVNVDDLDGFDLFCSPVHLFTW